jgi:hypothetical protein
MKKMILKVDANHGDWKTASVHKDRWPTLRAGTEVEFVKEWNNLYGRWLSVKAPNGSLYDIQPHKLEEKVLEEYLTKE